MGRFDSILVRLKVHVVEYELEDGEGFDSILVRLKENTDLTGG